MADGRIRARSPGLYPVRCIHRAGLSLYCRRGRAWPTYSSVGCGRGLLAPLIHRKAVGQQTLARYDDPRLEYVFGMVGTMGLVASGRYT
jgi:hypothetical protein